MSKDIKKALEHCVEWNCDNCPNRDELGSGETVCRGRLLPEVLEYVADLEAKLAESEKERHEEWKTGKEWKWEWQKVNQKLEKADQDKISFAIEQLEKVKETFIWGKDNGYLTPENAVNIIDNQIKQLKEGK